MALKDFSEGRTDVYKIDPRKLQIKAGWNTRDFSDPANIAHVEWLAKSIESEGVKEPLKVSLEDNIPYVTNGECRYRAVMLCLERGVDIKSVPVMGEDRFANEADRLFTQFTSNSGKPFGPIENARLFKRLLDMGWAQKDMAVKSGMTGGRISQLLELLTLTPALQKFITEGKASANMVMQLFKKHNQNEEATLAELNGAVKVAEESGRTRAMPKDTEDGGDGKAKGERGMSLKNHIKELVTQAYAEGMVDDTESKVTITFSEDDWADLMEKIGY